MTTIVIVAVRLTRFGVQVSSVITAVMATSVPLRRG